MNNRIDTTETFEGIIVVREIDLDVFEFGLKFLAVVGQDGCGSYIDPHKMVPPLESQSNDALAH